MSTIDQIAAAGGRAADFCDIGGGARAEVVAAALDAILSAGDVAAVLVSIFGGITRCDEVARGLVEVFGGAPIDVPVVVRLDGNAAEAGRDMLDRGRPARSHRGGERGRGRRAWSWRRGGNAARRRRPPGRGR